MSSLASDYVREILADPRIRDLYTHVNLASAVPHANLVQATDDLFADNRTVATQIIMTMRAFALKHFNPDNIRAHDGTYEHGINVFIAKNNVFFATNTGSLEKFLAVITVLERTTLLVMHGTPSNESIPAWLVFLGHVIHTVRIRADQLTANALAQRLEWNFGQSTIDLYSSSE
jgi:hypothetical protein